MTRVLRASFLVLAACLVPLLAAAQAPPASFAGVWEGKISTPMGSVRVVFHVEAQPDGSLKATMDSPDQGAAGIPMSRASAEKGALRLECQMIQGSFYGSLDKDGTLAGQWSQGGATLPLVLKRVDKAPGVSRPQEPKAPLPYRVEEVTYPSRKAGVTLAATLTLPEGS